MIGLSDWIEYIDIPFVPARQVTEIPVALVKRFNTHWYHLQSYLHAIDLQVREREMVRWDCCAPYTLKQSMAAGQHTYQPDYQRVTFDDPRLFDILYRDWNHEMIGVFARPWIDANIIDGYPEEYRVFVEGKQVVGVSNYYPQRPLPDALTETAEWAAELTQKILDHTNDALESFTADFIVDDGGDRMRWLEGGPGHAQGAHPCCFEPGKIDGIALEAP